MLEKNTIYILIFIVLITLVVCYMNYDSNDKSGSGVNIALDEYDDYNF